jgi:sugar phosphate isomerase/epimerase
MEFEIEKTQRTVWELADRIEFFDRMRPLLNIDDEDAAEIKEQLRERDFDYLEIAAYWGKQEDPDAALVFDGKKDFFWDIFNIKKADEIIKTIGNLAQPLTKLDHKRGLTQRDWRKRIEALEGF